VVGSVACHSALSARQRSRIGIQEFDVCRQTITYFSMNAAEQALLELKLLVLNMEDAALAPGYADERSDINVAIAVLPPPSVEELEAALSLGENCAFMSSDQCLRALLKQNSVMLREFIWRKKCTTEISTRSSSLHSSAVASSAGSSNAGSPSPFLRAPPANFDCPFCSHRYNEKDFDRHVHKWIGKENTPIKNGSCPGIRDPNCPLLQTFAGNHGERVQLLVSDIRSLLRPGAYDSMSPTGSGRHVNVAARFAALSAAS